jgi:hypothetical protein
MQETDLVSSAVDLSHGKMRKSNTIDASLITMATSGRGFFWQSYLVLLILLHIPSISTNKTPSFFVFLFEKNT